MKVINKKFIILSSVGLTILAGASVFAYQVNKPVEQKSVTATQVAPPVQEAEPVVEEAAKVEVVAPPAPTVVQAQPQPATPPPAPKIYKWASEMAAAGIAEADYGYVTDMVLSDTGWRDISEGHMWQGNNSSSLKGCDNNLVFCIGYADRWVKKNYASWKDANYIWVRAGNF